MRVVGRGSRWEAMNQLFSIHNRSLLAPWFRRIWLRALSVIAVLAYSQACLAGDLLESLKRIRATSRSADVDVRDTVRQHIPLTMKKVDALDLLKAEGFKVWSKAGADPGDEVVVASQDLSSRTFLGYDEARIIIKIEGGSLVDISGWLFLHAL